MKKIIIIIFLLITAKGFCQFEPIPKAITKPYKVYTALLSQTGTENPTVVVLENTLGETLNWVRSDEGNYVVYNPEIFIANKTTCIIQNRSIWNSDGQVATIQWDNTHQIEIQTFKADGAGYVDGVLYNQFIEIRVYN